MTAPSVTAANDPGTKRLHLAEHHRRQLADESGLPQEALVARGYETVTRKVDLKSKGFGEAQMNVPALLIPLWNAQGEIGGYQCKPDFPRIKNGKVLKYETPAGMHMLIDVPPAALHLLGNPAVPLIVTEGVKKADRTAAEGLCCIALLGVWNWRGTNGDGGITALADWEYIALKNRTVLIAFDSDVMTKAPVLGAMRRLREFLRGRGATVRICLLRPGPNGEKTGLDDFFVRGGSVDGLFQLVQDDLPEGTAAEPEAEYDARDDGIHWLKPTTDGHQDVLLCNFTARILREVTRTNGVDTSKVIEIEAKTSAGLLRVDMPIEKLGSTNWHLQTLGTRAVVQPGTTPQRLVHAIQMLSDPEVAHVHTHTGWTKFGDAYYYLNAGCVIGPDGPQGPLPETRVELGGRLAACVLPTPPTDDAMQVATSVMLEILEVADTSVTYPLLLGACRAALGNADFGIFLEGVTGERKTATAALFQAFWGGGFDARNLPGNWSSTANALEELLFVGKDMLVVIDDFVLSHAGDRPQMLAKADRVFRASANGGGRQRLTQKAEQRPDHPPRAMPLATGELVPGIVSLRARMMVLAVAKGSVNLPILTRLQKDAADGRFASAMAAFLSWLAPRLDRIRSIHKQHSESLRNELVPGGAHGRTVSAVADLIAMADVVADFLVHSGALEPNLRDGFVTDARAALMRVAAEQQEVLREADPVEQYFALLASALASGRIHLCYEEDDAAPEGLESACGWTRNLPNPSMAGAWSPRGQRAGWLAANGDAYLLPAVVDAAVQQLAREQGDHLTIGVALRKRMFEAGKLASTEMRANTRRLLVRKVLAKTRQEVLHIGAGTLWPDAHGGEPVALVAHGAASSDGQGTSDGPLAQEQWPNALGSGPRDIGNATATIHADAGGAA